MNLYIHTKTKLVSSFDRASDILNACILLWITYLDSDPMLGSEITEMSKPYIVCKEVIVQYSKRLGENNTEYPALIW